MRYPEPVPAPAQLPDQLPELPVEEPPGTAAAELRSVPPAAGSLDRLRAERAAGELLAALGVDLEAESTRETPRRMVDVYAELLTPNSFNPTTFPNDGDYDELVVARGIPFHSLCEHHLLPFIGVAHVGYLPGERIVGLSKLVRVVELYARSLQVQERSDHADRELARARARPQGSRRRDRGRAHVHVPARGSEARRHHDHVRVARPGPRRSPHPRRIPLPDRKARQWLTTKPI